MSEAELHILRSRLRGGILSKGRRGELRTWLPVGLINDPTGKVALDPDAAVKGAVRHLLESFDRTGSARASTLLSAAWFGHGRAVVGGDGSV